MKNNKYIRCGKGWTIERFFHVGNGRSKFLVPLLLLFLLAFSSCRNPKIIPDDKLALIFRDAFVTNAYTQSERINILDSLNIYEPVFKKYGYTVEDVQFTIGNFTKRKSDRLSDVVDSAIELLAADSRFYKRRVAITDSIGRIARDRFATTIYFDSLISVRRIADTSRLRITVPIDRPGTYEVSYYYFVDTLDRNNDLRPEHYLLDDRNRKSANITRRLKRFERDRFTASFIAGEHHRKLVIDLNAYARREDMKRPHLTVDSLTVTRYLPDRVARDSMAMELFDYSRIDSIVFHSEGWPRADSVVYIILPDETDNVALPADAGGTSAR